ncbi:MAG: nucleotidyl transferase AbiEii/AbiGii toxin family protein [Candidatus Rifleibacteriota bacterium]
MNSAINSMLEKYHRNALKEIVQEISLLGLYRCGFFNKVAFYGGTALRIFYGLDRFSEDLDFSLIEPDPNFMLKEFLKPLEDELGSFGFEMQVEEKRKSARSAIKSAFIKGDTQLHLLKIAAIKPPVSGLNPDEKLQVKIEIDTDPPGKANFEIKYQLLPVPFSVRLFDAPSLFAGKVHALLCRSWQNRVKGRDFYDYAWYLSRSIPLNIEHLQARLEQTGHLPGKKLEKQLLIKMLDERFEKIDFARAKEDVKAFVSNQESLELWSADFFSQITRQYLRCSV